MADTILNIQHLSKSFGQHEVLKDIDFTVSKGDVTSIIGASGSGKSTLLRCINLLETPTSGQILFHGEDMAGKHVNAPAYRAKVGMVFPHRGSAWDTHPPVRLSLPRSDPGCQETARH